MSIAKSDGLMHVDEDLVLEGTRKDPVVRDQVL